MKIVVLDDYQRVAATFAESLDAEVVFLHEHLTGAALADALRCAARGLRREGDEGTDRLRRRAVG